MNFTDSGRDKQRFLFRPKDWPIRLVVEVVAAYGGNFIDWIHTVNRKLESFRIVRAEKRSFLKRRLTQSLDADPFFVVCSIVRKLNFEIFH